MVRLAIGSSWQAKDLHREKTFKDEIGSSHRWPSLSISVRNDQKPSDRNFRDANLESGRFPDMSKRLPRRRDWECFDRETGDWAT